MWPNLHALLALACLLFMPGCTMAVVEYAGKEEIRDNRVAEITRAWRGADGDMVVCVRGWPAERARHASPVEYHVMVPLALFEDPARPSPLLVRRYGRRIGTIVIPPERTGEGCPERPANASDVVASNLGADFFAAVPPREASDEQIERFADPEAPGSALFGLGIASEPPAIALMYRHDAPVFEGSRLVWIDPGERSVKPNEAAHLALPLAVAFDLVVIAGVMILVFAATLLAA